MNKISKSDLDQIQLYTEQEKRLFEKKIPKDLKAAYVTLVMIGDSYVSGAVILGKSLKKSGTTVDLLCMVTDDVSKEGRELLSIYFKLVDVDYIDVKTPRGVYLDKIFTKFHIFNMTEYDKIAFIDADAIVFSHTDELFNLDTPAATLFEKYIYIYTDKKENYIAPPNNRIEWYDKYPEHNQIIPKYLTDDVLYSCNTGAMASLFLIKPDKEVFKDIMNDLTTENYYSYFLHTRSRWPEQQYMCLKFSGQWRSINPIFLGFQGYPHYTKVFSVHQAGSKPFLLRDEINDRQDTLYDDFNIWYYLLKQFMEEYPQYKDSPIFEETYAKIKKYDVDLYKLEDYEFLWK